jgi:hypothetical protein
MSMSQPLFFEPSVHFEKNAGEVMLPEDPNEWEAELMQELFKQVPYVADFEPHVVMDRVDGERGFGFGHVEVRNRTEVQHGADPTAVQAAGIKSARIPVVIKDRKLQPLDLLVTADSKILPLTEPRMRGALFRPQVFDITGRGPGDMSMIGQLYPPYRQNYGFGGGGATMSVGMGKEGSNGFCPPAEAWARFDQMHKMGSVLTAVLPTIGELDYHRFTDKLANDRGLQAQFVKNGPATGAALDKLAGYTPSDTSKLAQAALRHLKPSVVQLRKEAEGYSLKHATHACWQPVVSTLDHGEAVRVFGGKIVEAADTTGAATMDLGGGVAEDAQEDSAALISEFGIYKVQDEEGKELIGYVFPNLIDLDGQSLPVALFTNGSQMAVQGEIAGVSVGEGASLFEGPPRGKGVFYQIDNGHAQATIPLTIKATMASPEQGGVTMHAETFDGREVQVIVQPNLQAITPSPEGDHMLVPDTFSWLPLDEAEDTALVGDPAAFGAQAKAAQALSSVTLRAGGADSFSVTGFPVDKLAADEKSFLSLDDTMFLLGGLGADLEYAQKKIGEASAWSRPVSVRVAHYIKTAAQRIAESRKEAAARLEQVRERMPARVDLSKEAAIVPDPVAVDTVLSLGFLNAENLGVFISYLPAIDEAQSKMCELLLAARLGLRNIPVSGLEKAIRATEQTLEGLKTLAFEEN